MGGVFCKRTEQAIAPHYELSVLRDGRGKKLHVQRRGAFKGTQRYLSRRENHHYPCQRVAFVLVANVLLLGVQ